MGLANPLEVVVIRDLALRPRARSDEPPPADSPHLSDHQHRDVDELMDLLRCGRRRGVLCILARAHHARADRARGGEEAERTGDERTSVGEIARRLGMSQKNLSQHLAPLRTSGLIYATRRGQHREYEINPARVVYQHDQTTGRVQLQVFAAGGSGVSVTITVGNGNAP
jgi:DNA-binding transcriptional ArsR family regulator